MTDDLTYWSIRAKAAERELAELKRKMREPDEGLINEISMYPVSKHLWKKETMRTAWLAGVEYLLKE